MLVKFKIWLKKSGMKFVYDRSSNDAEDAKYHGHEVIDSLNSFDVLTKDGQSPLDRMLRGGFWGGIEDTFEIFVGDHYESKNGRKGLLDYALFFITVTPRRLLQLARDTWNTKLLPLSILSYVLIPIFEIARHTLAFAFTLAVSPLVGLVHIAVSFVRAKLKRQIKQLKVKQSDDKKEVQRRNLKEVYDYSHQLRHSWKADSYHHAKIDCRDYLHHDGESGMPSLVIQLRRYEADKTSRASVSRYHYFSHADSYRYNHVGSFGNYGLGLGGRYDHGYASYFPIYNWHEKTLETHHIEINQENAVGLRALFRLNKFDVVTKFKCQTGDEFLWEHMSDKQKAIKTRMLVYQGLDTRDKKNKSTYAVLEKSGIFDPKVMTHVFEFAGCAEPSLIDGLEELAAAKAKKLAAAEAKLDRDRRESKSESENAVTISEQQDLLKLW